MKILNFGSLNIDYTYTLNHIVQPGETITSPKLEIFAGGKGLNQSIALARAGAKVFHAGLIGSDGKFLKDICSENGVDTRYIKEIDTRTGNAIIQVSEEGENSIILYPGANRKQTKENIDKILQDFNKGDILLLQNEINLLDYLIETANKKGMIIVLNPSPFDENIAECNLNKVNLFLINEVEGEQITGEQSSDMILNKMQELYPLSHIVLTMGEKGSVYSYDGKRIFQEAKKTDVVDTTAAGDTFTGYLLSGLVHGLSKENSMKTAALASAIAVSRKGASLSIPRLNEISE